MGVMSPGPPGGRLSLRRHQPSGVRPSAADPQGPAGLEWAEEDWVAAQRPTLDA